MPTVRVTSTQGSRLLCMPLTRLGPGLWGTYLEATRSAGASYDRTSNCQSAHHTRLHDLIRALSTAGFQVEVDPVVHQQLKEARAKAVAEESEAKALHDAAVARMNVIDAELALRGLALYPYQRDGVRWLSHRKGAGLFDEMGLGKTVQALISAPAGAPILVIVPAAVKGVWVRETHRWRPELGFPRVRAGRNSFVWPKPGEMVVINYDVLPEPENVGDAQMPRYALPSWLPPPADGTVLILDECHMVKAPRARRTVATRLLAQAVRKAGGATWGLTGTPLLNRPQELWHVLRVLGVAEEAYGSWKHFRALFDELGNPRPQVAKQLREVSLMRRRLEVLPDLPTKTYREIGVPIDTETRALADAIVKKLEAAGLALAGIEDIAALVAATKTARLSIGEISRVRAALAKAKTGRLVEVVEEYEAQGKPLVVFSAHRGPVDLLATRPGWERISGEEEGMERTGIVNRFAEGQLAGLACTIRAAGVGIDGLQRASHEVVFVDLDWTPGWNQQAEDRVVRIGQDRGVTITTLIADHALDQKITELLARKTRIIDQAVNASARETVEEQFPENGHDLPAVTVKTTEQMRAEASPMALPLPNICALFDRVVAGGLARPWIRMKEFELKMAGQYSKYCGQIMVTNGRAYGTPDNTWYGRIGAGCFYPSSRCTPEVTDRLKAWDADLSSLAKDAAAYGHQTGMCCFCGLDLTDARSVTVGYGPYCAERYGMPWGDAVDQTVKLPLEEIAEDVSMDRAAEEGA